MSQKSQFIIKMVIIYFDAKPLSELHLSMLTILCQHQPGHQLGIEKVFREVKIITSLAMLTAALHVKGELVL